MPYAGPVPYLDGNPYPDPIAPGAVQGPAAGLFDGWGASLLPLEGQLGAAGAGLQAIEGGRASMTQPLAQAVGQYLSTPLQGAMTGLLTELTQPNPVGTKLPYSFTIPQLPSAQSPTFNLLQALVAQVNTYLNWLWNYLRQWAGVPFPGPLG